MAVDYFPHWAVGLIMSARPRFVSCHLINENELEGLPLYLCLLMTLFVATPCVFSSLALLTVIMTLLPLLSPIYIYINIYLLIEAVSSFRMLCSLFIDAQTHSGHADCVLNHRFPLVFLKALHFYAVHLCDALILNFVGSAVPHGALLFCT